jgi:hypothetical protein
MNIEKLVQIKLVNGEELIACYENFGDGGDEVSITYALSMSPLEFEYEETIDLDQTKSYYVLRPFISYTDDLANNVGINPNTIIALTTPSDAVVEQYLGSVSQIQETLGMGTKPQAVSSTDNVVSLRPLPASDD